MIEKILNNLKLKALNVGGDNKASHLLLEYAKRCRNEFKGHLNATLMGIAYGGEVEAVATLWGKRGSVFGYDTFEDLHPKHLSNDQESKEAVCMDEWYAKIGVEGLVLEYQRKMLLELGLNNAILVKGEVDKDSCKGVDKIHLAFLDMDLVESMKTGYEAVKDKIVPGGYLFIHDFLAFEALKPYHNKYMSKVLGANYVPHLPKVSEWVMEDLILQDDLWEIEDINEPSLLIILKKIK